MKSISSPTPGNAPATVTGPEGSRPVDVVYWNPKRPIISGALGRIAPRRPVNNFGDLLGPIVVQALADSILTPLSSDSETSPDELGTRGDGARLTSIGSILHFAMDGDTVWGTGRNGKEAEERHHFNKLDVRAVRGPRTRRFLLERGIDTPAVFGDPALLLPTLFPELRRWSQQKQYVTTVVPNLHDFKTMSNHPDVISPRRPVFECLERIARSERVVASSLHGVIVAESLGIPTVLVKPSAEPVFKYQDYFEGTGRYEVPFTGDYASAASAPPLPALEWAAQPLIDAFPDDLWVRDSYARLN